MKRKIVLQALNMKFNLNYEKTPLLRRRRSRGIKGNDEPSEVEYNLDTLETLDHTDIDATHHF